MPREPIPTHVEAPTRDIGDDLRSRPNLAEPPPLFPTRPDTLLPRVSQRAPYHAGAAPESSPSLQNTTTRGHVAAPTGPATGTLEMRRARTIRPRYNARPCGNLEAATRRQERTRVYIHSLHPRALPGSNKRKIVADARSSIPATPACVIDARAISLPASN